MKLLEEKILSDGVAVNENILKVDSFINHQVDPELMMALGKELAPSNIQVNAIACGVIDTQMNACFSEEERNALAEEIPAGRFGYAEEVAALALQLCTGNEYLTSQVITLDGGWY